MIDARRTALLFSLFALAPAAGGCALWHGRAAAGASPDGGVAPALDAAPARPDAAPTPPDAGPCAVPSEQFFVPGCGGEGIRITAGCYQPCSGPGDGACGPGLVCERTQIDPCSCAPGLDCCGSCAADVFLCLPWHSTPVRCEGRDYCSCTGACAPLIDLSSGCVCPCDEPFHCEGPPCDCACGGARYLGCALATQCATPQVYCEWPQRAELVDGCPVCVAPTR